MTPPWRNRDTSHVSFNLRSTTFDRKFGSKRRDGELRKRDRTFTKEREYIWRMRLWNVVFPCYRSFSPYRRFLRDTANFGKSENQTTFHSTTLREITYEADKGIFLQFITESVNKVVNPERSSFWLLPINPEW